MTLCFSTSARTNVHAQDKTDSDVISDKTGEKRLPGQSSEPYPDIVVPNSILRATKVLKEMDKVTPPDTREAFFRPEKIERPEIPQRPEIPDRPVRPERPQKPDKPNKP